MEWRGLLLFWDCNDLYLCVRACVRVCGCMPYLNHLTRAHIRLKDLMSSV